MADKIIIQRTRTIRVYLDGHPDSVSQSGYRYGGIHPPCEYVNEFLNISPHVHTEGYRKQFKHQGGW